MSENQVVEATTQKVEAKFRFKKDKMGNQRPTFVLPGMEVLTVAGLIDVISKGGKGLNLLLEVCQDTVRTAAASIVGDDEKITAETFPQSKITWEAIANQERAERTKIDEAVWEAFAKDYLEIMPALTNKDADQLGNAISVYVKKFSIVKTNKPVLTKLKEQLTIYVNHTQNGEAFSDIISLLMGKLDLYLTSNDVELIVNNL